MINLLNRCKGVAGMDKKNYQKIDNFLNDRHKKITQVENEIKLNELIDKKFRIEQEIKSDTYEIGFLSDLIDKTIGGRILLILRNPINIAPLLWSIIMFPMGGWILSILFENISPEKIISIGFTGLIGPLLMVALFGFWLFSTIGIWLRDDTEIMLKCITDSGLSNALQRKQALIDRKKEELSWVLENIDYLMQKDI